MATRGDNEGFVQTSLEEKGARHKDCYFPLSNKNASELKDTGNTIRFASDHRRRREIQINMCCAFW